MKKIVNWENIRLVLLFAIVISLFSFTANRNKSRKLKKSVVVFVGDNPLFVKKETVNKLLIENYKNASSIQKDKLDLNHLEKLLDSNEMIEKSDVFVSVDGILKAVVKQKTPIARIMQDNRSFYIGYEGSKMPLSDNFTARVVLVSGDFNKKNKEDLTNLLLVIYDDDFLRKNIISIQIMPNGSLKMLNRDFDYQINFGSIIKVEDKFRNYKAFYQKAILDSSLYHYKTIDLRFTQQVVCTK